MDGHTRRLLLASVPTVLYVVGSVLLCVRLVRRVPLRPFSMLPISLVLRMGFSLLVVASWFLWMMMHVQT